LDHKIKALYREKDNITNDADDRVKLELKKDELEKCKKKRKKMYAPPPCNFCVLRFCGLLYFNTNSSSVFFFQITNFVKCRYDEHKDKIKSVLKWLPSEKDLKKEITQAFGFVSKCFIDIFNRLPQ
jgi:DNA repair protein RAD50